MGIPISEGVIGTRYVSRRGRILKLLGFKDGTKTHVRVRVDITGRVINIPGTYEVDTLEGALTKLSPKLLEEGLKPPQLDPEEQEAVAAYAEDQASPEPAIQEQEAAYTADAVDNGLDVATKIDDEIIKANMIPRNCLDWFFLRAMGGLGGTATRQQLVLWAIAQKVFPNPDRDAVGQRVGLKLMDLQRKGYVKRVGKAEYQLIPVAKPSQQEGVAP